MQGEGRLGFLLGAALLGMLASCAPRVGIEISDRPIASLANRALIDASDYSANTRQVIKEEELGRTVRKDPGAAIRHLVSRESAGDRAKLRLAGAEIAFKSAERWREKEPNAALGMYLTAIDLSQSAPKLPASVERDSLIALYGEACGAFTTGFHRTHGPGAKRVKLEGATRAYRVDWVASGPGRLDPGFYDEIRPASYLEVKGFDNRYRRDGVGGAVVAHRKNTPERRAEDPFMAPPGYSVASTSMVTVNRAGDARITLHDLQDVDEASLAGRKYPLAADFTAPIATLIESNPAPKSGFLGMLKPMDYTQTEGLFLLTPYQKDRIPLILVHGLMSNPTVWREIGAACYADPFLRDNYQILSFYYPTGYPIPRNAARLRGAMKEFRKRYDPSGTNPNMRKMVMVGHSMGGILTNFQLRSSGDTFTDLILTKPLDEIEMEPDEKAKFRMMLEFEANRDIRRAIFVCAPHRGSKFADIQIGRFGSRLVQLPVRMLDRIGDSLQGATTDFGQSILTDPKTSIDNLKTDSPVLSTILECPMTYRPPFHSIIGDRGKGDTPDSSDGVVPYWSSHLKGAESELIVPEGHNATNHPDTVEEVRRILYLHLGRTKVPPLDGHP